MRQAPGRGPFVGWCATRILRKAAGRTETVREGESCGSSPQRRDAGKWWMIVRFPAGRVLLLDSLAKTTLFQNASLCRISLVRSCQIGTRADSVQHGKKTFFSVLLVKARRCSTRGKRWLRLTFFLQLCTTYLTPLGTKLGSKASKHDRKREKSKRKKKKREMK